MTLRNIMIVGWRTKRLSDQRAGRTWRKRGGDGGCIATAGGNFVTSLNARTAPTVAAARLKAAPMRYVETSWLKRRKGKRQRVPGSLGWKTYQKKVERASRYSVLMGRQVGVLMPLYRSLRRKKRRMCGFALGLGLSGHPSGSGRKSSTKGRRPSAAETVLA